MGSLTKPRFYARVSHGYPIVSGSVSTGRVHPKVDAYVFDRLHACRVVRHRVFHQQSCGFGPNIPSDKNLPTVVAGMSEQALAWAEAEAVELNAQAESAKAAA